MIRTVVYAGTRNIYRNMTTAAKSLLRHTRVDRVWFLIEDDEFPEELPDVIRCRNMTGQKWIDPESPNARKRWGWMSMTRLALPEMFPELDRCLWLDVDTIVNRDIGELLDMDLRSRPPFRYYNAGVMMMNLEALRGGMAERLIRRVNHHPMDFPDQDVINLLCQGEIRPINPTYNSNFWIVDVPDPVITHFAADRNYTERPLWKEYENMEWRVKDASEN